VNLLPASIVNSGGDSCWKWKNFQLWRARDLDLGSGNTAYCRALLMTYQMSLKSKKHFVDSRTDRHMRPAFLGWLGRIDLINLLQLSTVVIIRWMQPQLQQPQRLTELKFYGPPTQHRSFWRRSEKVLLETFGDVLTSQSLGLVLTNWNKHNKSKHASV